MKKILLSLIYTIAFIGFGCVLYLLVSVKIDNYLYAFKLSVYNNEIDSLFQPQALKSLKVKYIYKSGDLGTIYYVKVDTLSNIAIIESNNYHDIFLKEIETTSVERIDVSQAKTYSSIINDPFPLIQQVLNPRESTILKITFEKPFLLEKVIKDDYLWYVRGDFNYVAFGNTQNCSIVTFQGDKGKEILVVKHNGKLYFIIQTLVKKSLLELVKLRFEK